MSERAAEKDATWRCRLFGHTTEPRRNGTWTAMWKCTRCDADLRIPPPGEQHG